MKFCHHCAGPITQNIPEGDDKLRYSCMDCGVIFYQNPNNIVGTVPYFGDKVLLCKRAIEPRLGKWTLPAGFMENTETTLAGAIRETSEEAGAQIIVPRDSLYTLFNLPYINQVYWFFRAELANLDFAPGFESQEVKLFSEAEVPWDELAFTVVKSTLEYFFADRKCGKFPVRMFDVSYSKDRKVTVKQTSSSED